MSVALFKSGVLDPGHPPPARESNHHRAGDNRRLVIHLISDNLLSPSCSSVSLFLLMLGSCLLWSPVKTTLKRPWFAENNAEVVFKSVDAVHAVHGLSLEVPRLARLISQGLLPMNLLLFFGDDALVVFLTS